MKTTVELPDDLIHALEDEARRRSIPTGELIAELVSSAMRSHAARQRKSFTQAEAEAWLAGLQEIGKRIYEKSQDPRSMVEILQQDRR